MLFQIVSSYFVAGIITSNAKVVDAPPIIRYMIGWTLDRVAKYAKQKNWFFVAVG